MLSGQWKQQGNRTGGVMMAAVRRMNAVADMSGVLLDVLCGADAKVDGSEFLF